jgi:mannose-6-phosphate isomerase
LTKFIDAREKLSVQVHPSDEYALKNEGQYGKTEMWYVVDADEGAGLYMGLNAPVSREEFLSSVNDGTVEKHLSFTPVKSGDIFFIPAGTVHAIGAGTLIFEIQQNSTLTYRLYDYMRRDKDGNLRELHLERAMDVSVLDRYEGTPRDKNNPEIIGKCKYFEASKYQLNFTNKTFNVDKSSFISFTVISGEGSIDGTPVSRGDTVFCPAGAGEVDVATGASLEIIAVRVPEIG